MSEPNEKTPFLVLEDDANDAMLIQRAFTNAHCQAFVCRNTSEAKAYFTGAGMYGDRDLFPLPEIFITDLKLGDEWGIDFLEWLRSRREFEQLEVIVLSGVASPNDIRAARHLGARVLIKPSDSSALQELLVKLSRQFCATPIYPREGSVDGQAMGSSAWTS